MPYIPLFEPSLGPAGLPEPQAPPSMPSSKQASSIWGPQPASSPMAHWPDANALDSKPIQAQLSAVHAPVPRFAAPLRLSDDFIPDANRFLPGAVGEGRTKASAERTQMAVVEQLLRSLHLDSPEPTPATTPSRRLSSPSPPSVSSASSPSALTTPDNLSPLMSPHTIDYYSFPPTAQTPVYDRFPPFAPQLSSSQNVLPQHKSGDTDHYAPILRSKSLSSVATIRPFNPFNAASPNGQTIGGRPHQPIDSLKPQHRHVSMPTPAQVSADWIRPIDVPPLPPLPPMPMHQSLLRQPLLQTQSLDIPFSQRRVPSPPQSIQGLNEPINFLRLLQPTSQPPYDLFVQRIVKSSDQQASIFLQQKLKIADGFERMKIVDAIAARGFEMMTNRFGNWAVQRCLENPYDAEERRKLVSCMKGRVVELATNCYGTHVLQKALDCDDDTRIIIVSELLLKDPASTLINKHASHVFSKIMELTWTEPAPPIFAYFNNALRGKWASLACHETGSLVVQHVFENIEDDAKEEIIAELIQSFSEVVKNQWGSFCVQHLLEHGSPRHRSLALNEILDNFLDYATHEQGVKSIQKALKEGGPEVLDKICIRLCQTPKAGRRAIVVDLALNPMGSQLIANLLPSVNKEQRTLLYDAIKRHVVTLRGSKTGSRTVWLFDRMRAYYGFAPGQ